MRCGAGGTAGVPGAGRGRRGPVLVGFAPRFGRNRPTLPGWPDRHSGCRRRVADYAATVMDDVSPGSPDPAGAPDAPGAAGRADATGSPPYRPARRPVVRARATGTGTGAGCAGRWPRRRCRSRRAGRRSSTTSCGTRWSGWSGTCRRSPTSTSSSRRCRGRRGPGTTGRTRRCRWGPPWRRARAVRRRWWSTGGRWRSAPRGATSGRCWCTRSWWSRSRTCWA